MQNLTPKSNMKIYRITREYKRVRTVSPKGRVKYIDQMEESAEEIKPYDFIVDRLNSGRIEENISRLQRFVAALACQDAKKMLDVLDEQQYCGEEYRLELD
jgi:hypothetical protein